MNQEIYETVKTILVDTFKVPEDQVEPEATFESLELDSLDLVELTLAVEEETGVKIEDDEVEQIATVADAVAIVEKKQSVSA